MLKTPCTHPELIGALAACGHGDKILIADGNYPLGTAANPGCRIIYLNLTHGIPLATDVLAVLNEVVPVERAEVMLPESGEIPPIFAEFERILPAGLDGKAREEFYRLCREEKVKIAVATGEQRLFGNILLTVGVVQ